MYRLTLLALATLISQFSFGQIFLGQQDFPNPAELVSAAPDFGTTFEGGYQIGENVANFQIYSPTGNPLRLSDLLEDGKHLIMTTGSVTCERFVKTFDLDAQDIGYHITRQYMIDHMDDFTWVFVYGYEAHPGDIENCTSNCPALTIPAPNGDTIYQHQHYSDRLEAIQLWQSIVADDEYNFEFPFHMYADNPSNVVYNAFFQRPFGSLVVDCQGEVLHTSEWTNLWIGTDEGQDYLNALLEPSVTCEPGAYACDDQTVDTDLDGICDIQELWQGWNPNDPNDPDTTTDISFAESSEMQAYPNPFDNTIMLSNATTGDQVQLWDMQGRLVHSATIEAAELDLSMLDQGVYSLVWTSKTDQSKSQIVVKN